jgi:hypothetical protein
MDQKHIVASSIVLVLIIAGMFVYAYLKRTEIEQSGQPTTTVQEDPDSPYGNIVRIDAKHFYIDGTHTIAGEVLMPTPCDLLNWTSRSMKTAPEQVTVDFTVVNHASSTCAQVVTPQKFKVSFAAGKDAVIKATLQGRPIELNLVPAADGETPDNFEIFNKG